MTNEQREKLARIVRNVDAGAIHLGDAKNMIVDVVLRMDGADAVRMVERACRTEDEWRQTLSDIDDLSLEYRDEDLDLSLDIDFDRERLDDMPRPSCDS